MISRFQQTIKSTDPTLWLNLANAGRDEIESFDPHMMAVLIDRGIRKGADFIPVARVLLAPIVPSNSYGSYSEQLNLSLEAALTLENETHETGLDKNAQINQAERIRKIMLLKKWVARRVSSSAKAALCPDPC